jgi:hypothetical protein
MGTNAHSYRVANISPRHCGHGEHGDGDSGTFEMVGHESVVVVCRQPIVVVIINISNLFLQ